MLLTGWQFARRYFFFHGGTDLDALERGTEIHRPLAALTPNGELVAAERGMLEWTPVADLRSRTRRHFIWRRAIRDLAVGPQGEAVFVDEDGRLVSVAGDPPAVTRTLELPPREYQRLAFSPSGGTLVAVDGAGVALVVLANGEVRELPERSEARALRLRRTGLPRLRARWSHAGLLPGAAGPTAHRAVAARLGARGHTRGSRVLRFGPGRLHAETALVEDGRARPRGSAHRLPAVRRELVAAAVGHVAGTAAPGPLRA